jgi:hypothetical protein
MLKFIMTMLLSWESGENGDLQITDVAKKSQV